jgi:hypothetical protein
MGGDRGDAKPAGELEPKTAFLALMVDGGDAGEPALSLVVRGERMGECMPSSRLPVSMTLRASG